MGKANRQAANTLAGDGLSNGEVFRGSGQDSPQGLNGANPRTDRVLRTATPNTP